MLIQNSQEEEIIEQNASYVLGMYDMYKSDKEISAMLRMKGLNESIVQKILVKIKKPAYEKRLRQAKRIIFFAGLLLIVFVGIPYTAITLSGDSAGVFLNPDNNIKHDREGDGMLLFTFKMLLRLALYIIVLATIQFV